MSFRDNNNKYFLQNYFRIWKKKIELMNIDFKSNRL